MYWSYILPVMFFFISQPYPRAPSADRRETLLLDRKLAEFYNATPIRGRSPKENWGPKTCKILVDFIQLQTSIANISGMNQDIENLKAKWSRAIPPVFYEKKKSDELWSTNYRDLDVSLDPLKWTFSGDYISDHRGCCPLKSLQALEIDQDLLAHKPTWTGSPKKFNRENLKFGLKFSMWATITSGL